MDVVSVVTTTAATAVVYLKGLLWCREDMAVVSGVSTTDTTVVAYLKGFLWSGEEMGVVATQVQHKVVERMRHSVHSINCTLNICIYLTLHKFFLSAKRYKEEVKISNIPFNW
jgi:hypothetical protein